MLNRYGYFCFYKSKYEGNSGYFLVWQNKIATEFAGGTGSESNPYIIKTGAEL